MEPNRAGRPRLRGFAGDHAGSLVVCVMGAVLVVFSLVMYARQSKPEALGFTLLGVFCVVVGAVLPRVTEAAVSPQKFELKLSPAEQRAESVELSLPGNPDDEKFDEPNELPVAARWYLAGEALTRSSLLALRLRCTGADRSQALKRAVTTGKQVRITPGQARAIVRDVRPARSK